MGILDKIKEGIEDFTGGKWKNMSDYEAEAAAKKAPKAVIKKTEIIAAPEDDFPATDSKGKYLKPTVPTTMKKGGMIDHVEYTKKSAGGTHHSDIYKKHAGGHKVHNEHIKSFGKK